MTQSGKKAIVYPEGMPPTPWKGTVFFLVIMAVAVAVAVRGWMAEARTPKTEGVKTSVASDK